MKRSKPYNTHAHSHLEAFNTPIRVGEWEDHNVLHRRTWSILLLCIGQRLT